ncbi:MAG: phosphoadenylyl-sulfate reductase [Methylohalobius sp. ZOD2]
MTHPEFDLKHWQQALSDKGPRPILRTALTHFDHIALAFSGAEDVVLIDMACRIREDISVFTLDTGRLHPETYRFIEQVREHYPIRLDILSPDAEALRELVQNKGLFSFYRDGHQECCHIRKVAPLQRKLATLDAWISGQRRDQNPDTRQRIPEVALDPSFQGKSGSLIKFNPLANWTSEQVWDYIEAFDVPFNELHRRGFRSIGCEPCTRPTLPHQHEREGRWWWEESAKKECGIHRKPE